MHALGDLKEQQKKAHQRVLALLAATGSSGRRGHPQAGKKRLWGVDFWAWLRACALVNPGLQATLLADIRAAKSTDEQYGTMMERIHSLASLCTLAPACKVLLCLSDVGFRCAFIFCAKMRDFSRFCSGRKVTSWLGLVPVAVVKCRLPQDGRHIEAAPGC